MKATTIKYLPILLGVFFAWALAVSASPPIPSHPPAPTITATKAIEAATRFAGPDPDSVRYCCSVTLVEGGMTPAPHGSARHWLVIFQDAGGRRDQRKQVYVDMNGTASDVVPPMGKEKASPQTLLDQLKQRTDTVKSVYLTQTGSTVNLKDGRSLQSDSTELQSELAKAAKDAGIAYFWE